MKETILSQPRAPWSGAFFSAKYFLWRALALVVLFLAAHLMGLREYMTFISGTTASPDISWRESAFLGMLYLTLYMGAVVVAPILALAGGMLALWERDWRKESVK